MIAEILMAMPLTIVPILCLIWLMYVIKDIIIELKQIKVLEVTKLKLNKKEE